MRIFAVFAGLSAFLISPAFVSSVAAYNGVCAEGSCSYTEYCSSGTCEYQYEVNGDAEINVSVGCGSANSFHPPKSQKCSSPDVWQSSCKNRDDGSYLKCSCGSTGQGFILNVHPHC